MRGLDVAGDYRGWIARVEHRALGNDDVQRLEAAGVHRDLIVNQRAEDIQDRGLAHRRRGIEVRRLLWAGASEVNGRRTVRFVDRDGDDDVCAAVHLVLEVSVRQYVEHAPYGFLRIVLHVLHVRTHDRQAEMQNHFFQLFDPFGARRDLCAQVGQVLIDIARRVPARTEDRAHFVF